MSESDVTRNQMQPDVPTMVTRDQIYAAYDVGGLLNKLHWHSIQAWLLYDRQIDGASSSRRRQTAQEHAQEVDETFNKIGSQVAYVFPDLVVYQAQAIVRKYYRDWTESFANENHVRRLRDMDDACDYPWYFDADCPHTLPAHADDLLRDLEEFCSGEERLVSAISRRQFGR